MFLLLSAINRQLVILPNLNVCVWQKNHVTPSQAQRNIPMKEFRKPHQTL